MTHDLKCWPEFFQPVWNGQKRGELRKDDREYRVGDTLRLREWDPATEEYTGRWADLTVTHIVSESRFGLMTGFVMLSLGPIDYQGERYNTAWASADATSREGTGR